MSIYDNRICKSCGITFSGGPRAWYCPECRRLRQNELSRKRYGRPPARRLGSTDTCQNCGATYIVASGKQKYCEKCRPEMAKKIDAEQSLEYYNKNKDTINPKRYEKREEKRKSICVICGKIYDKTNPSLCCSDECRRIYKEKKKTHP